MTIKRTSHAVYATKEHLVWAPTYRRWIIREDIRQRAAEVWREVAAELQCEIEEMEVAQAHVPLCLHCPPKDAIAKAVGILKSMSASRLFHDVPALRRHLGGGECWEEGYCVRTVGDPGTAEVSKRDIRYHRDEEHKGDQRDLL